MACSFLAKLIIKQQKTKIKPPHPNLERLKPPHIHPQLNPQKKNQIQNKKPKTTTPKKNIQKKKKKLKKIK